MTQKITFNCKGRLLVLDQPQVMGIINMTPDSFFAESRKTAIDEVLYQAEKMISEGATMLDIGGQSTRPALWMIEADEEMQRVISVVEAIAINFPECFFIY